MGKSAKDKKNERDAKTRDKPREDKKKEARRSRPALQRRRRSPSIRGVSVDAHSPISIPPAEGQRMRLRTRLAPLRGSVAASARDPAVAEQALVVRRRPAGRLLGPEDNPPIWLRRKAWDDHYREADGVWKLLEVKRAHGRVHEFWQWEED